MAKNSLRALAAFSLSLVLGLARAQDSVDQDPPDRAARLSYLSGDVSMQPAGEEEWAPAILNRPLTTGDKVWTEHAARAEIEVGPAVVRLGDDTGFSFLNVDDDTIQMRMTAGVVYVNVRALQGNDHIEIDTPNVALSVLRPGNYRVEVNDAGDATTVKISDGEAEADGPGQNVVVHAQQVATFRGNDQLVADWGSLGSPDDFDRWNLDRDRRDERVAASRTAEYVSPDVTGYEDLDENGSWSSEPEYGYVWTPRHVVSDWSPYRYGRWVWISPWGWSWIDDAPWGYAPFHYGRWAHVRDRWCWVPGPRHERAVYAPALVGWVGSPGLNVSISVGSGVGWFPLGPREVWVPGRHFSRRYVERANVSNTVIVNRTYINEVYVNGGRNVDYRNRHAPGGFTAVSRNTFLSAGRTGDRHARMDEHEFARAAVSNTPHLLPGRESRLGGAARPNVRVPPRAVVDRQVVVKRAPPPAAARFTRARGSGEDLARPPGERFQRPPDRQQERDPRSDGNRDAVVERNRVDRPVSMSTQQNPQPAAQPAAPQGAPVQRTFQDRQHDDRPPKQRDGRGDDRSFERRSAEQRPQVDDQRRDSREQQQRQSQERDSHELQSLRERAASEQQQREMQQRVMQQREVQQHDSRETQQRVFQQQQQQQQQQERSQHQQDSERQRNDQQRQQQERQQQDRQQQGRQQQDRQPAQQPPPRPRSEPKQDDKPRRARNDDDNPRSQRQ